jgi:hypothetical protein
MLRLGPGYRASSIVRVCGAEAEELEELEELEEPDELEVVEDVLGDLVAKIPTAAARTMITITRTATMIREAALRVPNRSYTALRIRLSVIKD